MPQISVVWIYLFVIVTDAQFTVEPDASKTACEGKNHNFKWVYSVTPNDALSVTWRKDSLQVVTWVPATSGYFYGTGYSASKVSHNDNNGDITINSLSASDAGVYICVVTYDVTGTIVTSSNAELGISSCPISQMSTSIATERTTRINSISEFSDITLPIISGSTTTTRDISASTSSFLNDGTTNFYAKTETTTSYANTETSNLNTNIESSNFDENSQTYEIQTSTSRDILNSMPTYQSMLVTTAANDISGSFEISLQIMTETFAVTSNSISSYNEIISPSTIETRTTCRQTVSATSISLTVDTISDSFLLTLRVSSGFLIATDSSEYSILSMTIYPSYASDSNISSLGTLFSVSSLTSNTTNSAFEITNVPGVSIFSVKTETLLTTMTTATVDSSAITTVWKSESFLLSISDHHSPIRQIDTGTESPLMSTTLIGQISYTSRNEEPSISSYQYLTETIVTLPKISVSSQLSSSIIDTMNYFIHTENTLITSYLDTTKHSYLSFTDDFQTFSRDNPASVSASTPNFIQPKNHHSSLQTTEYNATFQTKFTSYVTTPFYKSNTDSAASGTYSKNNRTEKTYIYTSVMSSQTKLESMKGIQDLTTYFQSTYLEPYFQSTDVFFSSTISKYMLSTLQSTSFLTFNTIANTAMVDSSIETTNMLIFETQSGMPTNSADVSDFEIRRITTTIDFINVPIPSMIKPSSQQKNTVNSYIQIDASFKDSLFSSSHFSGSLSANYLGLTTLSLKVFESLSITPTSTVQSGLSEKNKIIFFISTTSAVVTIIMVILLIVFARMNMSKHIEKPRNEHDNISWSNSGIPSNTVCPDYSFTGKSIYPFVNTSSSSFKMYPYEHNWNDIV